MKNENTLSFKVASEEDIVSLVNKILEHHADNVADLAIANRLVLIYSMQENLAITDYHLLNKAVTLLVDSANNLANNHGVLTVGRLLKQLKGLHPETKVCIDYLNQSGWVNHDVLWEKQDIPVPAEEFDSPDVKEENGKRVLYSYNAAVMAFDGRETITRDGKKIFYIHAHY